MSAAEKQLEGPTRAEMTPLRLLHGLLDRLSWGAVLLLSLAGAVLAGAFVYLLVPLSFTSEASFLFNDQPDVISSLQLLAPGGGNGDTRGAAGAIGMLGGGGSSAAQRFEELARSRRLRRQLVETHGLAERFHMPAQQAEAELRTAISIRTLGRGTLLGGSGVGMAVGVTCQAGPRLRVWLGRPVAFKPNEAQTMSATMANDIVAFLDDYTTETSIQQARKTRVFVEKRTRTVESDLARAEARLLALQRQYRLLSPETKAEQLAEEIKTLTDAEAQSRVLEQNAAESVRLLRGQLPREATTRIEQTVTARNPLIERLEGELLDLQAKLQTEVAGGKLTTHPDLVALRKEMDGKEAQLQRVSHDVQDMVTRGINPVHDALSGKLVDQMVTLAGARAGARIAGSRLARAESRMQDLPPVAQEYVHLKRQVEMQGDLLSTLQKRLEMARIEEQRENSGKFQVLDPAEPPLRKSGPSSTKAALAVFVGLLFLLGIGRAYRLGWIALEDREPPADA